MTGTEQVLNTKVLQGLKAQFNPERTTAMVEQANTCFHYRNPHSPNSPELYELFESGFIDEALETLGFGRWAIGRPKLGNGSPKPKLGHNARARAKPEPPTLRTSTVETSGSLRDPSVVDLFLHHVPNPRETRVPFSQFSNAIEYRNVLIVGIRGVVKPLSARVSRKGSRTSGQISR